MTEKDQAREAHRVASRAGDRVALAVQPVAAAGPTTDLGAAVGPLPDPLNLSHELRTPLTTILGNAELMLEGATGPLSSAARAGLRDIQDAGRRLQRRVEEVLLLLDLRERRVLSSCESVDLVEVLCGTFPRGAGSNTVAVQVAPRSAPLIVDGDRDLLHIMAQIIVQIAAEQHNGCVGVVVEPLAASIGSLILHLDWPGFDAGCVRPMDAALIGQILRLHGAVGVWGADGMRSEWRASAV
jgi:His Kinase A (phospho-acceptor) domain